jgi:hypothetical protein
LILYPHLLVFHEWEIQKPWLAIYFIKLENVLKLLVKIMLHLYFVLLLLKLERNSPRYGAISRVSTRKWFPGMGAFGYFRKVAKTKPYLSPGWGGWVGVNIDSIVKRL